MSTIARPRLLALATIAVLGVTACASAAGSAGTDVGKAQSAAARRQVALSVTNHNFNDVDVYAVVAGTPERVTMVRSMNTVDAKLPLGASIHGNVQLVVDPIGGFNNFTTDRIVVNPGETIKLTVAQALSMSNWTVN
jgi:hypothetical protein